MSYLERRREEGNYLVCLAYMCYIVGGFIVPWAVCMLQVVRTLYVFNVRVWRPYSIDPEFSWQANLFGSKMSILVGLPPIGLLCLWTRFILVQFELEFGLRLKPTAFVFISIKVIWPKGQEVNLDKNLLSINTYQLEILALLWDETAWINGFGVGFQQISKDNTWRSPLPSYLLFLIEYFIWYQRASIQERKPIERASKA